ncbi:hypothetical protein [Nocardia asteroides]|uniref:hypothetical protein n=1 Tax=Nocardia asteroides TaxID=1824 RepID=UPI00342092F0
MPAHRVFGGGEHGDIREAHLQIFGAIRMGGVRLTELAARAQLSLTELDPAESRR